MLRVYWYWFIMNFNWQAKPSIQISTAKANETPARNKENTSGIDQQKGCGFSLG